MLAFGAPGVPRDEPEALRLLRRAGRHAGSDLRPRPAAHGRPSGPLRPGRRLYRGPDRGRAPDPPGGGAWLRAGAVAPRLAPPARPRREWRDDRHGG
ncbi:hypothetical protein [Falsiroseomonas stagni]|uniref:hypothetical protein n=1 Tax=Falsiroseomonas stagni TaxID=484882 RepID=UPI0038CD8E35